MSDDTRMTWQAAVQRTVTGMGYELVNTELSSAGLLRIYIDKAAANLTCNSSFASVGVEDCEKVTRQLQHVLEVENHSYTRLEVSSPGLDRPLKKIEDYCRFVGAQVDLTLNQAYMGRKKYRGKLLARDGGWGLVLGEVEAPLKTGTKGRARAVVKPERVLEFDLNDVREARLVPVLDFKACRTVPSATTSVGEGAAGSSSGGRS